jgi:hypothetical protein
MEEKFFSLYFSYYTLGYTTKPFDSTIILKFSSYCKDMVPIFADFLAELAKKSSFIFRPKLTLRVSMHPSSLAAPAGMFSWLVKERKVRTETVFAGFLYRAKLG